MELTEETLRKIAISITDLRLRLSLLQEITIVAKETRKELDEFMQQALETPKFQELCDQLFEQLKGNP